MGNEMGNNNATSLKEEENLSTVEDPKQLLSKDIPAHSIEDVSKEALDKKVPISKEESGDFFPHDCKLDENENLIDLKIEKIGPGPNDQLKEQALLIKKEDEMTNSLSSDNQEAENGQLEPLATSESSDETKQILEDPEVRADTEFVAMVAEKLAQSENDRQEPATIGLSSENEQISVSERLQENKVSEDREVKADTEGVEKLAHTENEKHESPGVGLSSENEQISMSDLLPETELLEDHEMRAETAAILPEKLALSEHDQQEPATVGFSSETEQIPSLVCLPEETDVLKDQEVTSDTEAVGIEPKNLSESESNQQEPAPTGSSSETEQISPSDRLPKTEVLEVLEVRVDTEAADIATSEKKNVDQSLQEHQKEESEEEKGLCGDEISVVASNDDPIDLGDKSYNESTMEASVIGVGSSETGEEITSMANSPNSRQIYRIAEKASEETRVLNGESDWKTAEQKDTVSVVIPEATEAISPSESETDESKSLLFECETVEEKATVSVAIPEEKRASESEAEDSKPPGFKCETEMVVPDKIWQDFEDKNAAILIAQLESLPFERKIEDDDWSSEKKMVEVDADQPLPSSPQEPKKNDATFDSNSLIEEIVVSMNYPETEKANRFVQKPESSPPPLETQPWSRESTDSDRDTVQYAQMRKSPSFSMDLQEEARNEDSDQTPLLYQDKAEIQVDTLPAINGHSDDRDRRAIPVEDNGVVERSEEESLIVAERREGNEVATSSIKVTISSSSGKSREKRAKVKSSLFGTCLCCTTVIN